MKERKKKRVGLFLSLASVMAVPIIVLGIALVIMGVESVSDGMEQEIKKALASTARETVAIFQLTYPGKIRMEDGRFMVGELDLTGDYTLVDQISENTGNDISIFCGTTRMLTTIKKGDTERFVNIDIGDPNIAAAIQMGNEYYSDKVQINGNYYYGYYVPLFNGEEVCGMVFAGMTNDSVFDSAKTIVTRFLIISVIALLAVIVMASAFAGNIVNSLNQIRDYIGSLAENKVDVRMSEAVLKRQDELGDVGRHAQEVGIQLKNLIYRDPLTELYNRRAGYVELSKYIDNAEASNGRKKVTVALGDIDFFKKVNDTYGHECGDIVLKEVAKVLQKAMDKMGVAIRWGGEEFLLAFMTDYDTSLKAVEAMLQEIRALEFEYEGKKFQITMTIGITSYSLNEKMEDVIKRADTLLYKGKTTGRNRIVEGS